MQKVKNIAEIIESFAPLSLAFDWDNCGLNIGSLESNVDGVLLCVDVTRDIIQQAINKKCNLIIAHHPLVWDKMRTVVDSDYQGNLLMHAISNNINIYCVHTNVDIASQGINDYLCNAFGINNLQCCDQSFRIGYVNNIQLDELAQIVLKVLGDSNIKTVGNLKEFCNKVAVGSGSCGRDDQLVELLRNHNVDTFITAEVKLSIARKCEFYNIKIIEYGHYESEQCFVKVISQWLHAVDIPVFIGEQKSPYNHKPQ